MKWSESEDPFRDEFLITDSDLFAFTGTHSKRYRNALNAIHASEFGQFKFLEQFKFIPFVAPLVWLAYRKLWQPFAASIAIILGGLICSWLGWLPLGGLLAHFGIACILAFIAYRLVLQKASQMVKVADERGLQGEVRASFLQANGGTSLPGAVLGGLTTVTVLFAGIAPELAWFG